MGFSTLLTPLSPVFCVKFHRLKSWCGLFALLALNLWFSQREWGVGECLPLEKEISAQEGHLLQLTGESEASHCSCRLFLQNEISLDDSVAISFTAMIHLSGS